MTIKKIKEFFKARKLIDFSIWQYKDQFQLGSMFCISKAIVDEDTKEVYAIAHGHLWIDLGWFSIEISILDEKEK